MSDNSVETNETPSDRKKHVSKAECQVVIA